MVLAPHSVGATPHTSHHGDVRKERAFLHGPHMPHSQEGSNAPAGRAPAHGDVLHWLWPVSGKTTGLRVPRVDAVAGASSGSGTRPVLARAPETQRSRCPAERGRRRAALPGPETPLLSAAEQHGVQGRERAQPAHVQRSDPGAVELKGKARPRLSGASPGRPPHACPAGPAAVPPVSAPGMSESPKPSRGRAGAGPSFPAGWQQGPPTTTWQDF